MYPYEDDDETPGNQSVARRESWTFDQRSVHQPAPPYQSPHLRDDTTKAHAVPPGRNVRARHAGGYPPVDGGRRRRSAGAWWRNRSVLAVCLSVLAVLLLGTAGIGLLSSGAEPARTALDPGTSTATPSVTPSPTSSPSPGPTPSARRSARPSSPAATRTRNPVPTAPPTAPPPAAEVPPAPVVTKTPDPTCTPTYKGTNAPKAQVRDALVESGATQFWVGVQRPVDLDGPLPEITVPANLMKAIAWQESGWQSAIIACDGGIGTMQVMPGTVSQINNRFGTNHDVNTLQGNTDLGANYLQWLIMYFGLFYFGQNFDLSVEAPIGPNGAQLSLVEVVVAAYNVGPAALENEDNTLSIPNRQYVNNVLALQTSCDCLNF